MIMMKALIVIPTITLLILNLADGAPAPKKGVSTYFEWQEDGCEKWPVDTLDPDELGTLSNANLVAESNDETGEITQMEFVYELWKCTPGEKATNTHFSRNPETSTTTSVVVSDSLKEGSFNSTFFATIFIDEFRFGKDAYYKRSQKQTEVNIQATFVGTGGIYTLTQKVPYTSQGPARDATFSFSLTAKDGTLMPVPPASVAQNSGYMYRRDK
jgi:hypothetical protein